MLAEAYSPGTTIDRYTVDRVLGQGGMAVVYRVRHNQLGTWHALKVLLMPARSVQKRLLQEGRVQATLRHPNIVAVTDVVDVEGAPGLVMEYIDGPTFDSLLSDGRLTLDQADALAEGILAGVAFAHDHGLIHRDLKPANILLKVEANGITPKVTDFGLAKILSGEDGPSSGQTRSGASMGTPAYMAPEQIRDAKNVDRRADVFSLGVILYELVCGNRPFAGDDTYEMFQAIMTGNYADPRELEPDLPERMRNAIVGALDNDRDRRIRDCHELLAVWQGRQTHAGTPAPAGQRRSGPWDARILERASSLGSRGTGAVEVSTIPEPMEARPDATWSQSPAPAPVRAPEKLPSPAPTRVPPSETMADAPVIAPVPTTQATSRRWLALGVVVGIAALVTVGVLAFQPSEMSEAPPSSEVLVVPPPTEPSPPAPATVPEPPAVLEPQTPAVRDATTKPPAAAKPIAVQAKPAPEPKSVAEPAVSVAPVTEPKPAAAAQVGRLTIRSVPYSEITLDGAALGPTSWKGEATAGDHSLVLVTKTGLRVSKSIVVRANQDNGFCWDFELSASCPQ